MRTKPPSAFLDRRPLLIGVAHLPPLPGAPRWVPGTGDAWLERAVEDARTLAESGFDAVVVENFGDAPFFRERVPPETTAAMAVAARRVRDALPPSVAVGVNVLRNDGAAALAIAAAAGLQFVRINVLSGAVVADQGIVQGNAAEWLRLRARIAPQVSILADVGVKHSVPIAPRPLDEEAEDLLERGGADAIIVTGTRTGRPVEAGALERLRSQLPDAVLIVGSGASLDTVSGLLDHADGVIVATAIEQDGRTAAPVERARAEAFVQRARAR